MSALAWGVAAAALGFVAYKLFRLAIADADLGLLSKGPAPPQAFSGKVVWVVGASQGVGEMITTDLAKRGAKLILTSRRADRLEVSKQPFKQTACKQPGTSVA